MLDTNPIEIEWDHSSPKSLTQAVLQCAERLGFYQAEMASILGITCVEVGQMNRGQFGINLNSTSAKNAQLLIAVFNRLFVLLEGDEAKIHNWLRRSHPGFEHTPLIEMVDYSGVERVLRKI